MCTYQSAEICPNTSLIKKYQIVEHLKRIQRFGIGTWSLDRCKSVQLLLHPSIQRKRQSIYISIQISSLLVDATKAWLSNTLCRNDTGPPSCRASVRLECGGPTERHSSSNESRSISCDRSGRYGSERTPSPSASCVRPQHRSLRPACALSGRTQKKFPQRWLNGQNWQRQCWHCKTETGTLCRLLLVKRRMQDAAYQASVRRGHVFAEVGFGIGELAKHTDMRDDFGAMWLPIKMLSAQGEQAWQRMIVGSIASWLVRALFLVFPNNETTSGMPTCCRFGGLQCTFTVPV